MYRISMVVRPTLYQTCSRKKQGSGLFRCRLRAHNLSSNRQRTKVGLYVWRHGISGERISLLSFETGDWETYLKQEFNWPRDTSFNGQISFLRLVFTLFDVDDLKIFPRSTSRTPNWRREGGERTHLYGTAKGSLHSSGGTDFGRCPETQSPNGQGNLDSESLSP